MPSVRVEKTINAPVDVVFKTLSNIPEAHENVTDITHIEMLSEGPVGVGTRWKETRKMFGKEATEEMWITEFNPNRNYVVEAKSNGAEYRTNIQFDDLGSKTKVAMEFYATPISFVAKLMTPLSWVMKGMLRKCLEKDLDDCKVICEGSRGATSNG